MVRSGFVKEGIRSNGSTLKVIKVIYDVTNREKLYNWIGKRCRTEVVALAKHRWRHKAENKLIFLSSIYFERCWFLVFVATAATTTTTTTTSITTTTMKTTTTAAESFIWLQINERRGRRCWRWATSKKLKTRNAAAEMFGISKHAPNFSKKIRHSNEF